MDENKGTMDENKGLILVVEDDNDIRTIIKRSLELHGLTVIEAASGEIALEKVRKHDVDIAILDIKMPGISGLDVLKELSVFRPDIGVIMATAVDDRQTAVDTMRIGAYDYITKPFSSDDIVQTVRKALLKKKLKVNERLRRAEVQDKLSEQSQQLTSQFRQLMATMMREHHLLYQLEKQKQSGSHQEPMPGLPPELQKPMSSVDEFKEALLKLLKRQQIE